MRHAWCRPSLRHAPFTCKSAGNPDSAAIAAHPCGGASGTSMPTSPSLLLRVFAGAIFLSAALLFAVQPMFTKMVLPRLGGTPSVWSVAMVFFQAVLLAGYAYAHALTKYFPGKRVDHRPSRRDGGRRACSCRSRSRLVGPPAGRRDRRALAARPVCGVDRPAVLRALGQRPAAAGVVRPHRSSLRRQSLLSLCGEQRRQLPRAASRIRSCSSRSPRSASSAGSGPCCSSC